MHLAADAAPLCTLWTGDPCAELVLSRVWGGAGLVTLRQTFVRRRHLGWTASEPPHFSKERDVITARDAVAAAAGRQRA
jgi:hypothetical protein